LIFVVSWLQTRIVNCEMRDVRLVRS
jgi:hypothetical protein